MKVIFLDIDGVLNHDGCKETIDGYYFVEEEFILNLAQIIEETNAEVVLSSTWRLGWLEMDSNMDTQNVKHFKALRDKLREYDIEFLSRTPLMSHNNDMRERGKEITSWLEHWGGEPIESYVILDDLEPWYLQPHLDNLVHTFFEEGLKHRQVHEAIKILNAVDKKEPNAPGYILIKNIPKGCEECDYCNANFDYGYLYCSLSSPGYIAQIYDDDEDNTEYTNKRLANCPIKSFPEQLKIEDLNDEYDTGWCMGHNSCLDMIINGGND